ncbi:hypothetical protein HYFRA_00009419 [Hymenoscyphus fraxineus]|uniref:NAD(P)-binding domain-containing protein n=1 Tax=Hymenoscyphus fraxineus TaxID=746836 RepID=A0A9N9PX25_9HELO|nr:hypothetical protein HYFRA_00009419 [Hymenoscyphus fraxineus]
MKVLLLGVTGNVGSRMLPALLARNHRVVAYVRTPSKIPSEAKSKLDAIITGSATDSEAIKAAIISHNCDAVVNAAGVAAITRFHSQGDFSTIFAAVVKAAREAGRERGGAPIRCWLMSGFGILDSPKKPYTMADYIPMFPAHKPNYMLIKSQPVEELAWSLFCATQMFPKYDTPRYPADTDAASNLVAKADAPPAWTEKFRGVPLIGDYLNVMAQSQSYFSVLENCVDFVAADLEMGLRSEWIGKRVGVREKSKVKAM